MKQYHTRIHLYLCMLIALSLPFGQGTAWLITLLALNWLVEGGFKIKFRYFVKNKFAWLFISLYLVNVIGLAYTENFEAGLFSLQVKLSILIIPVIMLSQPLSGIDRNKIYFSFVIGCICSALVLLCVACYYYLFFGENRFFYERLSILLHPSYGSMYFNLAVMGLLLNLTKGKNSQFSVAMPIPKIVSVLIILFLSFTVVLLSSKLGILTLIITCFGTIVWYILYRKMYLIGSGAFILMVFIFWFGFRMMPQVAGRLNRFTEVISSTPANRKEVESTTVRMLIWKAANSVISHNFLFGAGTGDGKDELKKEYEKEGMTGALGRNLNAHNQYYEVTLALGCVGLSVLIATLFLPLWFSLKTNNTIYTLFLSLIIINLIPESMLERESGVMFYAFFNTVLCAFPAADD